VNFLRWSYDDFWAWIENHGLAIDDTRNNLIKRKGIMTLFAFSEKYIYSWQYQMEKLLKTSDINIKEEIRPSSKTTFLINLHIIKHRRIFKVEHLKIISKNPQNNLFQVVGRNFSFTKFYLEHLSIWRGQVIILHFDYQFTNFPILKG
jgi:hypothetical protein